MKKIWGSLLVIMLGLSVACGGPASESETDGQMPVAGMEIQMNDSMRTAHHATLPEEYAGLSSPVAADEASLARGADLYTANCAVCHGDTGLGETAAGQALVPPASAIARTSQMLGDDYLYWRISEGGTGAPLTSGMPAWDGILDEQARWDLINYMRALGAGSVQPGGPGSGQGGQGQGGQGQGGQGQGGQGQGGQGQGGQGQGGQGQGGQGQGGQGQGGQSLGRQNQSSQENGEILVADRHASMLAQGLEQGVITQAEADNFAAVHAELDAMPAAGRGAQGNMEQVMGNRLNNMVAGGRLTQAEVDSFWAVHQRLLDAGLME